MSQARVPPTLAPTVVFQAPNGRALLLGNICAMQSFGPGQSRAGARERTYFVTCSEQEFVWQDERLSLEEPAAGDVRRSRRAAARFLLLLPDLVRRIDLQLTRRRRDVLVHCFWGRSRSVAVALGYLMWKKRLTPDEAGDALDACGHWVQTPAPPPAAAPVYGDALAIWSTLLRVNEYSLTLTALRCVGQLAMP